MKQNKQELLVRKNRCPRCFGQMKRGIVLVSSIRSDFPADKLARCKKCEKCGHSVVI